MTVEVARMTVLHSDPGSVPGMTVNNKILNQVQDDRICLRSRVKPGMTREESRDDEGKQVATLHSH
jgi:hypothetical protein